MRVPQATAAVIWSTCSATDHRANWAGSISGLRPGDDFTPSQLALIRLDASRGGGTLGQLGALVEYVDSVLAMIEGELSR